MHHIKFGECLHKHVQQLHWLLNEYRINTKLLTLFSILHITHSLHIYIPSCAFTLPLIPKVVQYQSAHCSVDMDFPASN